MSANTIAAARRQWECFIADDIPGVLAFLDPEVEIRDDPALPDASVYIGHDGYLAQIDKFRDAFDDLRWEPVKFLDRDDKVVTEVRIGGVAKASRIFGQFTYYELLTWRDDKIVRVEYFITKESALAAAGLA